MTDQKINLPIDPEKGYSGRLEYAAVYETTGEPRTMESIEDVLIQTFRRVRAIIPEDLQDQVTYRHVRAIPSSKHSPMAMNGWVEWVYEPCKCELLRWDRLSIYSDQGYFCVTCKKVFTNEEAEGKEKCPDCGEAFK